MKKLNLNLSNRIYRVLGFETGYAVDIKYTLYQLHEDENNTSELIYTLQEDIDSILDLKGGETLYVRLARDHKQSIGVLIRLN